MRFTLRQLVYFVAAGETGGVTLAAERVTISPPSISAAIAQLEAEFGIQLFVRHHAQGLSLTPAGKRFLAESKALLAQAEGLYDFADNITSAVTGTLHVGVFRTYAPLFIPDLCQTFLEKYPRVDFRVFESSEQGLLEKLNRAEISMAITYSLNVTSDMTFVPLAEIPTHLLLSANHPRAKEKSIALASMIDDPFILLDLPLSRDYFLAMFERLALTPRIVARSEYPEMVRAYVGSGLGYSLMSSRPVNQSSLNGKPLAYVPIADDFPVLKLGIATLKGLKKTRVSQAFEDHCKAMITTERTPGMAPLGS
jgi:DNA-binding transcriptional LysR family regulator